MFRRKFIAALMSASGGGLGTIGGTPSASENRTVIYRIKGFSCITCAVGLDTMLRQKRGVVHSDSSYSAGTTTIQFNPALVNEGSLKAFISEMGFRVEDGHDADQ